MEVTKVWIDECVPARRIPRVGHKFEVRRGKGKRKAVVVIDAIYRRPPYSWVSNERMRHRWWYEVFYRTDGTWAQHGRRSMTLRGFLIMARPK